MLGAPANNCCHSSYQLKSAHDFTGKWWRSSISHDTDVKRGLLQSIDKSKKMWIKLRNLFRGSSAGHGSWGSQIFPLMMNTTLFWEVHCVWTIAEQDAKMRSSLIPVLSGWMLVDINHLIASQRLRNRHSIIQHAIHMKSPGHQDDSGCLKCSIGMDTSNLIRIYQIWVFVCKMDYCQQGV